MVVIFLVPVLVGVGWARCAGRGVLRDGASSRSCRSRSSRSRREPAVTLLLVNTFPARRARDILMLMGLLFAASLVIVLRFIRPEQLMRVESLPDLTDFFATLQSPITPLLPSFWAGETIFASLVGGRDLLHAAALWTTALASIVILGAASERWHFAGYSRSQEAPKARFTHFRALDVAGRRAAVVAGPPPPADQGPEDLPARRDPVVAAAAAARAGAAVSLQLQRARSAAHSVHERLPQERLRVRQPGHGRTRDGDGRRAVRVSAVSPKAPRSGSSARRRSRCATFCGRSSGPASCRCCC